MKVVIKIIENKKMLLNLLQQHFVQFFTTSNYVYTKYKLTF